MIILFVFSLVLMIRKYTSMRSLFLMLMILFLNVALFGVILYVAKSGTYYFPRQWLFLLDYKGYLMLSKIKMPFYHVIRMQNIGFAGFLACMPFFLRNRKLGADRMNLSREALKVALVVVLPLLYVILHDPAIKIKLIFSLYKTGSKGTEFYQKLFRFVNVLDYIWIFCYMLFPVLKLVGICIKTKTRVKRMQALSLAACLLLLNSFCSAIFLWGPYRQGYDTDINVMLGFFPANTISHYYYNLLSVMIFAIAIVLLIILFKFSGLDNLDFFRNHAISKAVQKNNRNFSGILHSFKNILFSLKVLAEQTEMAQTQEERDYLLERIKTILDHSLSHTTIALNSLRGVEVYSAENDVTQCLDNAIGQINFDQNITVKRHYASGIMALCDTRCLEEAFVNILKNAKEAIALSGREDGVIDIRIDIDYEWVVIKIEDNGIGIPKKNQGKIFKSFYTTKSVSENWGVGLNYVYKCVRQMKGFVQVKSVEKKYTVITVMLQKI